MSRAQDLTASDEGSQSDAPRRRIGRPLAYAPEEERSMMIRAAYRVLARADSGSVTVSEILTEAQLSTRSFYRHFKSKDQLLLSMFEEESERATAQLTERLASAPDPYTAIGEWIRFYIQLAFEPRRHRRTLVMQTLELHRVAGYAETLARHQELNRAPLIQALEAGAAQGTFRHTRPASDAVMIQDIANNVLLRRRDGIEQNDSETVMATICEFLSRAIGVQH
ncbi:transcriptional regulator, TetR family [Frankia torreyi]|uniref:Transcriptional regulator, TetR family n=1 Tax=Frankia torreyi TaxID=1856 RepID=A0A0D8BCF2_9ACTN|nr:MULTISPECIES: TetR/AcrR family transcriptional regulator [Frankia]KJE21644.1 transcriptional regulator, TetR family [Frankia torreyi]